MAIVNDQTTKMTKLFYSYSHKDEALRNRLHTHLIPLSRNGLITQIYDRQITVGSDLEASIDQSLSEADIILCLVTPAYIESEYCYSKEMERAFERRKVGQCIVIPVIMVTCGWDLTPFKDLRGTPRDNLPVNRWPDEDEALNYVMRDVQVALEKRQKSIEVQKAIEAEKRAQRAALRRAKTQKTVELERQLDAESQTNRIEVSDPATPDSVATPVKTANSIPVPAPSPAQEPELVERVQVRPAAVQPDVILSIQHKQRIRIKRKSISKISISVLALTLVLFFVIGGILLFGSASISGNSAISQTQLDEAQKVQPSKIHGFQKIPPNDLP